MIADTPCPGYTSREVNSPCWSGVAAYSANNFMQKDASEKCRVDGMRRAHGWTQSFKAGTQYLK